jgi:hypothetical protein
VIDDQEQSLNCRLPLRTLVCRLGKLLDELAGIAIASVLRSMAARTGAASPPSRSTRSCS